MSEERVQNDFRAVTVGPVEMKKVIGPDEKELGAILLAPNLRSQRRV